MIGMDVGTTQSKIASVDPTGKPFIIMNGRGQPHTPSIVYLPPDGEPLVGTDAEEHGYIDPSNQLRNFKLKLGSGESLLAHGPRVNPTNATSILIAHLKECAEKTLDREVSECVATCPANFRDDSKQALLEAFERNGINVLKLVPEPTAAGFAYALHNARQGSRILVYDFGGGTFDTSVTEVQGAQISILATDGVAQLGGNDLNEPIRQRLLSEIENKFGEIPSRDTDALLFQEIDNKAEQAKISLGNRSDVPCVIGYKGSQIVAKLTQQEYHKSIEGLICQSLESVDRAIQGAGLSYGDIDHLLLVGGTSRLPYIKDMIEQHTGLTAKSDIDPEKAIAYGAALACISEMESRGQTATIRGQVIPAPEMFAKDVAAHSVGCCVVDISTSTKRLVNSVIIPKNTSIPCQKTDRFFLEHEHQTVATIEILQGEAEAERDECLIIGELVLDSLPKEAKRTQRIHVEYMIDGNGMVTVSATDKVSGKIQTVSVDYKKGIKPKDKPALV